MHQLVQNSHPMMQLLICGPVGLSAGIAITFALPPTRRTALDVLTTISEFLGFRPAVAGGGTP
jgi:hypothetical protein